MLPCRRSLSALALSLMAATSHAQTPPPAPWSRELTAVTAVMESPLRAAVEALPEGAVVGLRIDAPDGLAAGLGPWAAGVLGAAGRTVATLSEGADAEALTAQARAAHAGAFVWVRGAVVGGGCRVEAAVVEREGELWRTFLAEREPAGAVRWTTTQEAALSARTRAALGIPLAPRWPAVALGRPRTIATPFRGVLAMAATDLDGDGREELVMVLPERVRAARVNGASLAFVPDGQAQLGPLGSAPMPLRQPVASLAVDPALGLLVRTSQCAEMGVLRLVNNQLGVTAVASADVYPAQGLGCVALTPGSDQVRALGPCGGAGSMAAVSGAVGAVPVAITVGGTRWEAFADLGGRVEVRVRDAPDGRVLRTVTVADMAPPLVLADLEDDGAVELLGASASEPGGPDRLRVFTLRAGGAEERPGVATPGPIEALAAGDLDGDGLREVVVSVGDPGRHATTLWVLP